MNERVREIYKQSVDYCAEIKATDAWVWEEKFAELIIKECADLATSNYWNPSKAILKHFDIK